MAQYKGGYQIIDFKDTALSGTATEISGVYDIIEGTRLPIYIENLLIGETERKSVLVDFIASGDNFIAFVNGYKITVDDDDKVKAEAVVTGFTKATAQADSTASDVAGVVADLNTLIGKLKTAGIMANS